MAHDIIVVAERRDRQLGQRDAQVSLYCRTCVIQNDNKYSEYQWLGTREIFTPAEIAEILRTHHANQEVV